MKNLMLLSLSLLMLTSCAKSESKYPFVGKRYFNFWGGTGTGESIRINSDGTCIIIGYGCCGVKPTLIYEGEFKNPLMIYDTENGSTEQGKFETGFFIKDNRIYLLNSTGEREKDCNGDGKVCASELYK